MSSSERRRLGVVGAVGRRRRRRSPGSPDDPLSLSDRAVDAERTRRSKRRRFDSPPPPQKRKPIKYGYYGQVKPGKLQLELVSCDGGEHRDPRNPSVSLAPENILRYDKSVYCSERSSSTVIIRHADDTPFCLDKLHIIGPEHGFTAPVRAGVVHIAMTMAHLQKYVEPPPRPYRRHLSRQSSIQQSPERLTLSDALRDPGVNAAMRERELDPRSLRRSSIEIDQAIEDYLANTAPANPPEQTTIAAPIISQSDGDASDGLVCTLLFDSEPGPEDPSSQETLDFRLHRLRTSRRRYDIEHWDRDDPPRRFTRAPPSQIPTFADIDRASSERQALTHLMARSRVHDSPPSFIPIEPPFDRDRALDHVGPEDIAAEETAYLDDITALARDDEVDGDVWTRRFLICTGKSRVAMRFEPPISGRFVMLKLWSGSENVDVQAVVAEGWGGGRFFPAVEMR